MLVFIAGSLGRQASIRDWTDWSVVDGGLESLRADSYGEIHSSSTNGICVARVIELKIDNLQFGLASQNHYLA